MKNMTNFALPLMIIMWHRMLQEYFWTNSDKTFFDLGDNLERKKEQKDTPYGDNLYMETPDGFKTKVTIFCCFKSNRNLKDSPDVCLSLVEWALYILEPVMETNNQIKAGIKWLKGRPMKTYTIKDFVINWRVHQEETAPMAPTLPKDDVEYDIKNQPTAMLLKNIRLALEAAKRTIDSIKQNKKLIDMKMNNRLPRKLHCLYNAFKRGTKRRRLKT
jgi:hypothetical protein